MRYFGIQASEVFEYVQASYLTIGTTLVNAGAAGRPAGGPDFGLVYTVDPSCLAVERMAGSR
jgi:hypothetical protein